MKKEDNKVIIIVSSIILGVFLAVCLFNLRFTNEEDTYYSTDIIKSIDYINNKLNLTTNDEIVAVCVKSTKSTPEIDSLCWKDVLNNRVTLSIYEYKTYYIWTKDNQDTINYYTKYNTHDEINKN